jgi:hypothetical protein
MVAMNAKANATAGQNEFSRHSSDFPPRPSRPCRRTGEPLPLCWGSNPLTYIDPLGKQIGSWWPGQTQGKVPWFLPDWPNREMDTQCVFDCMIRKLKQIVTDEGYEKAIEAAVWRFMEQGLKVVTECVLPFTKFGVTGAEFINDRYECDKEYNPTPNQ